MVSGLATSASHSGLISECDDIVQGRTYSHGRGWVVNFFDQRLQNCKKIIHWVLFIMQSLYQLTLSSLEYIFSNIALKALLNCSRILVNSVIGWFGVYWLLWVHNFNRSTVCKNKLLIRKCGNCGIVSDLMNANLNAWLSAKYVSIRPFSTVFQF